MASTTSGQSGSALLSRWYVLAGTLMACGENQNEQFGKATAMPRCTSDHTDAGATGRVVSVAALVKTARMRRREDLNSRDLIPQRFGFDSIWDSITIPNLIGKLKICPPLPLAPAETKPLTKNEQLKIAIPTLCRNHLRRPWRIRLRTVFRG